MADNIETQILSEINKTGFPLELRVSEWLRKWNYSPKHSVYYLDNDESKGRELDVFAHRFSWKEKRKILWYVDNFLTIECKKSDKPWVIFTSPKDGDDDNNIFLYDHIVEQNLEMPTWTSDTIWDAVINPITEVSPLFKCPRIGRTYFVPFANSETSEIIYKSLTTAVKAAVSVKENTGYAGSRISFYYPTVVLQGRLFESYLDKGESKISEAEIIPVSFTYKSAKYKPINFIVPIVTEKVFEKYLSSLDDTLNLWLELLKDGVEFIYDVDSDKM